MNSPTHPLAGLSGHSHRVMKTLPLSHSPTRRPIARTRFLVPMLAALAIGSRVMALDIIPTFDSSITNLPSGSDVVLSIRAAIFEYKYRVADPNRAFVVFKADESVGLGASSTATNAQAYPDYRAKLAALSRSPLDALAVASLPVTTNNPVNANPLVRLRQAHERALGFNVPDSTDSTLRFKTSITRVSPSAAYPPNGYSLYAVVCHEINEVLGLGSVLTNLNNGDPAPNGPVEAEDLFRYDQNNNRSFTTDANALAYFYVPGYGRVGRFNQTVNPAGDFNDWYQDGFQPPRVQNWQATVGVDPRLSDQEMNAFDAIGYTVLPTPVWCDVVSGSDTGAGSYFAPLKTVATADGSVGSGGAILMVATGNPTLHTNRVSVATPCKITPFNGTLRIAP